ncbi:DUF5789 family protein [Haloferax mediterranei]|uniref:DUF5789 family protein n=1 Tax=Haloferax mediterranei TaxID=2252 RepID=UPI000AE1A581|nr:hypothetical protein [Haloferax mediterranei]
MEIRELPALLESELTYPVDTGHVVDQIGNVELDTPATDTSETIGVILAPLGATTFDSPNELYNTILGNVSDDFIGRKFYDDRGANPGGPPRTRQTRLTRFSRSEGASGPRPSTSLLDVLVLPKRQGRFAFILTSFE